MKKIYSFVLMATMLIFSANVWAAGEYTINGVGKSSLQAAVTAAQAADGATQTIYLNEDFEDGTKVVINTDKHIILDLKTYTLTMNVESKKDVAIKVERGILEIKNGTLQNGSFADASYTVDLIRVIGSNQTGINAATQTPYSQVIVASNAHVLNSSTPNSNTDIKYNALTITEHPTKVGEFFYANGARIDVYGEVVGTTYGIKVNGNISRPASDDDAPYVYIHAGAILSTDAQGSGSVAAYSSGYGRWRIEGICTGSTGLYAKGGDIDIVGNAQISSNNTSTVATETGKGSGVAAGGSAIVIESNAKYPGHISVTIADEATITGKSGYAIEETIAENTGNNTYVESISIQGGNIDGGSAGAVIVTDKTKGEVTVVGGEITGNVTAGTTVLTEEEAMYQFLPGGNNDDNAYYVEVTQDPETGKYSYEVQPDLSRAVTINSYGWSTFSADEDRRLPDGLTAYKALYTPGDDAIELVQLNGNIPANTGVILAGETNGAFTLGGNNVTDLADNLEGNKLVRWDAYSFAETQNIYVLVGYELYKYMGATMKKNKAYLDLGTDQSPYGAPARVRMVIAETEEVEQTEAVERVEAASVKAVKFVENGEILIRRGENVYNLQGQIVK